MSLVVVYVQTDLCYILYQIKIEYTSRCFTLGVIARALVKHGDAKHD